MGGKIISKLQFIAQLYIALSAAAFSLPSTSEPLPPCLKLNQQETIQSTLIRTQPAPSALLARLVYAEGRSTGHVEESGLYKAIAWGVMNRVRLSAASRTIRRQFGAGLEGVIFQKGQFNPAISPRSPFSRDFLCPQALSRWALAAEAARIALDGQNNPFIQTPWERQHHLSLVVNFYYPQSSQARGLLAPWESSPTLRFIGAATIDGRVVSSTSIRLYRLVTPPPLEPSQPTASRQP